MNAYRIVSRWPAWARWRIVTPRPHGEREPFDSEGLLFLTKLGAESCRDDLARANSGEYRVIPVTIPDPVPMFEEHGR